jgi:hypothetical protein
MVHQYALVRECPLADLPYIEIRIEGIIKAQFPDANKVDSVCEFWDFQIGPYYTLESIAQDLFQFVAVSRLQLYATVTSVAEEGLTYMYNNHRVLPSYH